MGSLRKHIRDEHSKQLCALCIENKKVFPSEQIVYSEAEYDKHLKCGDGDGSEGHPKCQFCNKRYYDKNMLFAHLEKDHYSCHICVKNGSQFKYYKNYECLENHFRQMHYICEEKSCLEKRFVVFGNNIDYVSHLHSWHPSLQVSRSIPVSFKSYGDNSSRGENWIDNFGEGPESYIGSSTARYDGGVGGGAVNGEWQVTMPQGARDPREAVRLAAARRQGSEQQQQQQIEHTYAPTDYPSLQGEAVTGGLLGSGGSAKWSQGGPGVNNRGGQVDDYPALMGAERKAPLGHSRQSNWSSRIKVDKKLSVRKSAMPGVRRDMLNSSVASATPVEDATYSGPFAYSLQQQIDQQLQNGAAHYGKKSQTQSSYISPKPDTKADLQQHQLQQQKEQHALKSKSRDELTLAEKIRIEQLKKEESIAKAAKQQSAPKSKKDPRGMASTVSTVSTAKRAPAVPLPPGLGLFAPPPVPSTSASSKASTSTKTTTSTATVPKKQAVNVVKPATQPTVETKKKSVTKANNAAAVGGWGAALSAGGLASKKKSTKKPSLTVVKKSTPQPQVSSTSPTPPPPGFGDPPGMSSDTITPTATASTPFPQSYVKSGSNLTDSDFPSFTQTEKKKAVPKKTTEEKWTKISVSKGSGNSGVNGNASPKKAFPGSWVPSIGGSGGSRKQGEAANVSGPPITSSDFPDFSAVVGQSGGSKNTSQKIKKSGKSNFIKIS